MNGRISYKNKYMVTDYLRNYDENLLIDLKHNKTIKEIVKTEKIDITKVKEFDEFDTDKYTLEFYLYPYIILYYILILDKPVSHILLKRNNEICGTYLNMFITINNSIEEDEKIIKVLNGSIIGLTKRYYKFNFEKLLLNNFKTILYAFKNCKNSIIKSYFITRIGINYKYNDIMIRLILRNGNKRYNCSNNFIFERLLNFNKYANIPAQFPIFCANSQLLIINKLYKFISKDLSLLDELNISDDIKNELLLSNL